MKIKFCIDVNVRVEGMDELVGAIRGDLSSEDKEQLQETLYRVKQHVRRLERLDRETPAAE